MSSTAVVSSPAFLPAKPEILQLTLATDSAIAVSVTFRKPIDPAQPGEDEMKMACKLFDTLLQQVPFDNWGD